MSLASVLSGSPAALAIGQLGVASEPIATIIAAPGNLNISETQAVGSAAGIVIASTTPGADCSLYHSASNAAGASAAYRWVVGGATAGGIVEGKYQLFIYPPGGGAIQQSVRVGLDGVMEFADGNQCNVVTIPAGAATSVVGAPSITASSVVLLTPQLNDATATSLAAVLNPGVGFTITAPANATANLPVSWFIARY